MRTPRRAVFVFLIAFGTAVSPLSLVLASREDQAPPAGDAERRAQSLLARARERVGGETNLNRVNRLIIDMTDTLTAGKPKPPRPRAFKLMLPDRFQSSFTGFVTHTLDRGSFWMDRTVEPGVLKTAEYSTRARFLQMSVTYLLRGPAGPNVGMRATGETANVAGVEGDVIEFTDASRATVKLVLDRTSCQPLALLLPVYNSVSGAAESEVRLEEYREVGGIRFPFRLVNTSAKIVSAVLDLKVNEGLTEAAFKQPTSAAAPSQPRRP